jgi:hypothetical protein
MIVQADGSLAAATTAAAVTPAGAGGAAGLGAGAIGQAVQMATGGTSPPAGGNAAIDLESFKNAKLPGGFSIESVEMAPRSLVDVSGGPAYGGTSMNVGTGAMQIRLSPGLTATEQSVTLYHEVLESASMQAYYRGTLPAFLADLSETELDILAKMAHEQFGPTSVESLTQFLRAVGF